MANLHKDIIEANWNTWAVSNDLTTFLYQELKRYKGLDDAYKRGGHGPGLKEIIKKDHQEYSALVANIKDRSKLLGRLQKSLFSCYVLWFLWFRTEMDWNAAIIGWLELFNTHIHINHRLLIVKIKCLMVCNPAKMFTCL